MLRSVTASRLALAASLCLGTASLFCACEASRPTGTPGTSSTAQSPPVTKAEDSTPEPIYIAGMNVPLWSDEFERDTTAVDSTAADSTAADSTAADPTVNHAADPTVNHAADPLTSYVTLNPDFIHLDPGAGIGGSTAVRFDWIRSTACTDDSRLIERVFPDTPELFVQFSVRYSPGFVFDWRGNGPCVGNAKKIFFLWARSGSRFDVISENHVLGVGSDNDHPLFPQNIGQAITPEQLADGQWHRFTFHVRQSSTPTATDGSVQCWIDGRLKWSRSGIATNNSGGYYDFKLPTTFNQGSPATQSEWLDGLRIWR